MDVTELEKDSKLEEIQVIEYCNRYTMLGMQYYLGLPFDPNNSFGVQKVIESLALKKELPTKHIKNSIKSINIFLFLYKNLLFYRN